MWVRGTIQFFKLRDGKGLPGGGENLILAEQQTKTTRGWTKIKSAKALKNYKLVNWGEERGEDTTYLDMPFGRILGVGEISEREEGGN